MKLGPVQTSLRQRAWETLPPKVRSQLDAWWEALQVFSHVRDPRVLGSLGPSAVRGLVLRRGRQGRPTLVRANHQAHFDWTYPHDNPEMADLYRRAKQGQWDGDDLSWSTDVDPMNPEVPLIPEDFLAYDALEEFGVRLDARERREVAHGVAAWMLSQFLHGEQGALFAAAQVTEAVQFFDGKFYGATQVMDEGRHIEVFHRYLTKRWVC